MRTMRRSIGVKPSSAMGRPYPSFAGPRSQHVPGVDAGAVAVVPTDADPPRPDELGPFGAEGLGAARLRPDRLSPVTKPPALGTGAVHPQFLESEARHDAVVPLDGEAAVAFEVDGRRLVGAHGR